MAEERPTRTLNCPVCGGPLAAPGRQSCPYCGSKIDVAAGEPPARPTISAPTPLPMAPGARRRGCLSPLVFILAAILLVGGLVLFLLKPQPGPGFKTLVGLARTVQSAAILLPTDRQGPPDVLVVTYDASSEQRYLSYIDGAKGTLLWDSPPVSTNLYKEGIVLRGGTIYLVDKMALLALNASDGQVAWQATLSDSVVNYCQGCLRVIGNTVVVLSQDGVLQAYEAQGGRPAWSVRLNETPRNLWEIGGWVAVLDYEQPNEVYSIALQLRDPATGQVVQSFPGNCQEGDYRDELPIYSPNIVFDPSGETVYFLYGLLPACAQRWNLETGQLEWQLSAPDHYFDRFNSPPLMADGRLYGSYSGRVVAVDAEQGEIALLADEQDYELALQEKLGNTLIVLARRQRGSTRYELWGMDADSGRVLWEYVPQDQEPITEAGGWAADQVFAWCPTRDGLGILHLIADPPTLLTGMLDLRNGQETALQTSSLDNDLWAGLVCSGNTAWLTTLKLYAIDLTSGKVISTWP